MLLFSESFLLAITSYAAVVDILLKFFFFFLKAIYDY